MAYIFKPVFQIRDILRRILDPYTGLRKHIRVVTYPGGPDPAFFVSSFQDANKKLAVYLHLHQSSEITGH